MNNWVEKGNNCPPPCLCIIENSEFSNIVPSKITFPSGLVTV